MLSYMYRDQIGMGAVKRSPVRKKAGSSVASRGDTDAKSVLTKLIAQLKEAEGELAPVATAAAKVTNNTKLTPDVTDTKGKQEFEWKAAQNLYAQVMVYGIKQMSKPKQAGSAENPLASQIRSLMGEFSDTNNKTIGERFAIGLRMADIFNSLSQQVSGSKELLTNVQKLIRGAQAAKQDVTSVLQEAVKKIQGRLSVLQSAAQGGKTAFETLKATNPQAAAKIVAFFRKATAKPTTKTAQAQTPASAYVNPYDAAMQSAVGVTSQPSAPQVADSGLHYDYGTHMWVDKNTYVPEILAHPESYPSYSGAVQSGGSGDIPPFIGPEQPAQTEPPPQPVQQTVPPATPQLPYNVAGMGEMPDTGKTALKYALVMGGVTYLVARGFGAKPKSAAIVAAAITVGVPLWLTASYRP